jgi:hypothetical protein
MTGHKWGVIPSGRLHENTVHGFLRLGSGQTRSRRTVWLYWYSSSYPFALSVVEGLRDGLPMVWRRKEFFLPPEVASQALPIFHRRLISSVPSNIVIKYFTEVTDA